jgi:hypothetical protein
VELARALNGSNNNAELLAAAIRLLVLADERSRARTVLGRLPDLKVFLEQRMPFLKAALEDGDDQGARELLRAWVRHAQLQQGGL